MGASREATSSIRDEDLIELFSRRLPELLERWPDLEPTLSHAFLKAFARREEVALVVAELRALRTGVDRCIDRFRDAVDTRFYRKYEWIDRFMARWAIHDECQFRRTMLELLEESFGVDVEQRSIAGEQLDVVIHDHRHVLVVIAVAVGRTILARLERKCRLYEESTGVRPARIILATADIRSYRGEQLRQAGIVVIQPELDDDDPPGETTAATGV